MTKTDKQIAHEARNAAAKAAAAQRKVERFLGHVETNNQVAVNAVEARKARIQAHVQRNEEAALAAATLAFAEAIEAIHGIAANDNAAIAKAA